MAAMTKYAAIDTVPEPDAGFAPASEEDEVARRLLRPCFPSDRELLLLAGFDAFERLVAFERSEEHTSELQSLMRISYAVFCLKKKKKTNTTLHKHREINYTTKVLIINTPQR